MKYFILTVFAQSQEAATTTSANDPLEKAWVIAGPLLIVAVIGAYFLFKNFMNKMDSIGSETERE